MDKRGHVVAPPSPQAGQSLVETTLLGIFVLVPLFLITPLLGKYIDLQDSTLQAARNAAFERTVWSETGQRNGMATAQEGNGQVAAKTIIRSFGTQDTGISSAAVGAGQYTPRVLWVDQAGHALLPNYSRVTVHLAQGSSGDPPDQVLSKTLTVVGALAQGGPTLDFNGLFTATVQASPVNVTYPPPFNALNLVFSAHDTLLANGWSALNPGKVMNQTQATLPRPEPALRTFMDAEKAGVPDIQQLHLETVLTDSPQEVPADRLGGTGG